MHHNLIARALAGRSADQQGATAVEYALMLSLITVVIATSVFAFGQAIIGLFGTLAPTL